MTSWLRLGWDREEPSFIAEASFVKAPLNSRVGTSNPTSNAKGKGRARATDEDADADDQVEEIIPDADEEKRFEEEHEDKVRALVLGKKPTQGVSLVNSTMNPLRFGVLLDPMH